MSKAVKISPKEKPRKGTMDFSFSDKELAQVKAKKAAVVDSRGRKSQTESSRKHQTRLSDAAAAAAARTTLTLTAGIRVRKREVEAQKGAEE